MTVLNFQCHWSMLKSLLHVSAGRVASVRHTHTHHTLYRSLVLRLDRFHVTVSSLLWAPFQTIHHIAGLSRQPASALVPLRYFLEWPVQTKWLSNQHMSWHTVLLLFDIEVVHFNGFATVKRGQLIMVCSNSSVHYINKINTRAAWRHYRQVVA